MYFLSYSRQEFYFAEYLALALQERDIPVWFDTQQLRAGIDWAKTIELALQSSEGLILVASGASLQSPYVAIEWEAALEQKKPVYVVVFEAVDLPQNLRQSLIFDFRSQFEAGFARLVQALMGDSTRSDVLSTHTRFHILTSVSRDVALLSSTLFTGGLFGVIFTLVSAPLLKYQATSFLVFLYAFTSYLFVDTGLRFLRRRFSYMRLRWTLILLLLNTLIFFGSYTLPSGVDPDLRGIGEIHWLSLYGIMQYTSWFPTPETGSMMWYLARGLFWVSIGISVISLIGLVRLRQSASLLRWMPLGQAQQGLYNRVKKQFSKQHVTTAESVTSDKRTYYVYFHEADRHIYNSVNWLLKADSTLKELSKPDSEIDIPTVILSEFTPLEVLEAINERHTSLIVIVVSSVQVPSSLSRFHQYQWVDYRMRELTALNELVAQVGYGQTEHFSRHHPVPQGLSRFIAPSDIQGLAVLWRVLGAITFAPGVIFLALFVMNAGDFEKVRQYFYLGTSETIQVWLIPLFLVVGMFRFWLADRLMLRRITRSWYPVAAILALLPQLISGGLIISAFIALVVYGTRESVSSWLPDVIGRRYSEIDLRTYRLRSLAMNILLVVIVVVYYVLVELRPV
ncbi:MAG: toll/interleukin-1 receptor domain-containing protein [Anaerolineae bacterium]|nr:toll/interleukin-1 receptor domain-containing protein [Anaerolineae bacterium]